MTRRQSFGYAAALALSLTLALAASWTPLATQIDKDVYDWNLRMHSPGEWEPRSILLAIDEESYRAAGGRLRAALADGLELIAPYRPKAVAIDVILADAQDPEENRRLAAAMAKLPNVVLASPISGGAWEEPLPVFRAAAASMGHVYAEPDPVSRSILLHKAAGRDRRWALALEAYRAGTGLPIVETERDLRIGDLVIPAPDRSLRIRYVPPPRAVPQVTVARLRANPDLGREFAGRTVFAGATAQSAYDRLQTPYSTVPMPGVEIHANVFETIANGLFLTDAPAWAPLALCVALTALTAAAFALLSGLRAYLAAAAVVAAAMAAPYAAFTQSMVLPFTAPVFTAWLAAAAAATYQHFAVRRRMITAEGDRTRYQQAMHFVTHEMRTPLTAIQGSSELMGRYALTEEKRKQMAQLINSESKRLGRMIEIFLSVERLSAGQLELKQEQFQGLELMSACVDRVRPLADRKQIRITMLPGEDAVLTGDRELMEYAFYNLLTNAVKYSPPETEVSVSTQRDSGRVRIAVQDQGIGIDQKELSQIFRKFYRTRKAEESGEAGTGIGLSIVEQIVIQHGGSIEVTSSPGRGSCFTLVLPSKVSHMVESQ